MLALGMAGSTQAALVADQSVGFDFSVGTNPTTGPASVDGVNFAQVIAENAAVELDGSGSFIDYDHVGGKWAGLDVKHVTVAEPGYHDDYLNDFIVAHSGGSIVITFTGLDTSLTYNVDLLAGATTDTGLHSGWTMVTAGQANKTMAPSATANGIVSYTGLTAQGSGMNGTLTFTAQDATVGISAGMITAKAPVTMTPGQPIGFDISINGTTGPASVDGVDFIQVTDTVNAVELLAGSGASLLVTNGNKFAGADGSHVTVAQAGYDADYLNDFAAVYAGAQIVMTFSGLDTEQTYKVDLLIGATNDSNIKNGTLFAADGQEQLCVPTSGANGIVSLTGLAPDVSGTLIITGSQFEYAVGSFSTGAISAGMITAEPTLTPGEPIGFDVSITGTSGSPGTTGPAAVDGVDFIQVTDTVNAVELLAYSGAYLHVVDSSVFSGYLGSRQLVAQAGYDEAYLNDYAIAHGAPIVMTFTGLDPARTYAVDLVIGATSDTGIKRGTLFAADGQEQVCAPSEAANGVVTFTGLQPDESGTLVITGSRIEYQPGSWTVGALSAGMITLEKSFTDGQTVGFDFSVSQAGGNGIPGSGSVDGINFIQVTDTVTPTELDNTGSFLHVTNNNHYAGFDGARQPIAQAGYEEAYLNDFVATYGNVGDRQIFLNFSGLNRELTYTVELVTGATSDAAIGEGFTISTAGHDDQILQPTTTENGIVTLAGLTPDQNGDLIITASQIEYTSGSWSTPAISAGKITAATPSFPPSSPVQVWNAQTQFEDDASDNIHTFADFRVVNAADSKLVVAVGGEGTGDASTVTYGGVSLTLAESINSQDVSIWYLDDPVAGDADIVVTLTSNQASRIVALSLANAADGIGSSTSGRDDGIVQLDLDLDTVYPNSLLVGAFVNDAAGISSTPFDTGVTVVGATSGSSTMHVGYLTEEDLVNPAATYSWVNDASDLCSAVLVAISPAGEVVAAPMDDLSDFDAPTVAVTPTIDGTLDVGEWGDSIILELSYPDLTVLPNVGAISNGGAADADPADISAKFYYKWDADYLYVGFSVTDDVHIGGDPAGAYPLTPGYPNDHVLFGFNPDIANTVWDNTLTFEMFVDSLGNTGTVIYKDGLTSLVLTNSVFAGSTDGANWNFEAKLKWTEILNDGAYIPAAGDTFGTALLLCDNDADDGNRDVFLYSIGGGSVMTEPANWHVVTLAGPQNSFANYISQHAVGIWDQPGDDLDLDGVDNFTEYALGGDPTVSDAPSIQPVGELAIQGEDDVFAFTYNRRIGATALGLSYAVKGKTDLTAPTWSTAGIDPEAEVTTLNDEFEAVTATTPMSDSDKKFLHLEITD